MYKYKFKISKISTWIIIGIWKIQKNKTPPTGDIFTRGKYQGYGLDVYRGQLTNPEEGTSLLLGIVTSFLLRNSVRFRSTFVYEILTLLNPNQCHIAGLP